MEEMRTVRCSWPDTVASQELDEIRVGSMDGLTYLEVELMHEEEYRERQAHKLTYRYPGGER